MTCLSDVELSDFIMGYARPPAAARVERHIEECATCREVISAAADHFGRLCACCGEKFVPEALDECLGCGWKDICGTCMREHHCGRRRHYKWNASVEAESYRMNLKSQPRAHTPTG